MATLHGLVHWKEFECVEATRYELQHITAGMLYYNKPFGSTTIVCESKGSLERRSACPDSTVSGVQKAVHYSKSSLQQGL